MNLNRASILFLLATGVLLGCNQKEKPQKGDRPVVVMSTQVKQGQLPQEISTNGHVEAIQMVEIRPQVNAQVAGIHFKEGDEVKAGQLLFTLDARKDQTQANRSQAVRKQIEAQLAEADRNLERTIELAQAKFISPSAVDTARAKAESLRAQLTAAQADQNAAAVQLSFARISAPFAGRTGKINIRTGGLAQANSTEALVTLTQLDPVRISFNVAERDLPALLAAQKNTRLDVLATLPDGSQRKGQLVFLDSTVDKNSGTLLAKAEFANADRQLWPGLSTAIQIKLGDEKGLLLPLQAIQTGPEQRFVYTIAEDKTVKPHPVVVQRIHDGQALVTGVAQGTKVVREGGQNLRPGSKVIEASRPASREASRP